MNVNDLNICEVPLGPLTEPTLKLQKNRELK